MYLGYMYDDILSFLYRCNGRELSFFCIGMYNDLDGMHKVEKFANTWKQNTIFG